MMTRSASGSPLATPKLKLAGGVSLPPQAVKTAPDETTADMALSWMTNSLREFDWIRIWSMAELSGLLMNKQQSLSSACDGFVNQPAGCIFDGTKLFVRIWLGDRQFVGEPTARQQ